MPAEPTQQQSNEDQLHARDLSLQRTRPPTEIPGYEIERFLGSGAYGEVWVGTDRKTGRRVAIKFYTHRGGVDWSLLNREVEKLVLLSADRYVVQLLDVGWDADPPYYVMEYVENGSLDDWLDTHGPMNIPQAVDLFREVATGLLHAHGRGVLHCDLKPANVLLDQEARPRLADFGQSRLTHEQAPSLGTLFYMAPEQASLEAVPDARWDVYALGAMLYCTLTGAPPHRSDDAIQKMESSKDLSERLQRYRVLIMEAAVADAHRQVPGMDRAMADLIDRCLVADPKRRFSNVQAVLDALNTRERQRARRPLMVLGFIGPLVLLVIMALFGMLGYHRAKTDSDLALTERAQEKNYYAAKAVAGAAAEEIQRYFRAVQRVVEEPEFHERVAGLQRAGTETATLLADLRDPNLNKTSLPSRDRFRDHPERLELQRRIDALLDDHRVPNASSWFVTDANGTQLAAAFDEPNIASTVGQNYGWRTYFHGGSDDLVERPANSLSDDTVYRSPSPNEHIGDVHLSAPFQSKATNRWKVAVSVPVLRDGRFVGVVALTVDIGVFVQFDEGSRRFFAVLVDTRPGAREGMILQHPLFDELHKTQDRLPDSFSGRRVRLSQFMNGGSRNYEDPLGEESAGADYRKRWISAIAPVMLETRRETDGGRIVTDTGLKVVVQEDYEGAIQPVRDLGVRLLREGLMALGVVVAVVLTMWTIVLRAMRDDPSGGKTSASRRGDMTPLHDQSTIPAPRIAGKRRDASGRTKNGS
ncbi:MAG: serine/threonine protein kinase [Planctomycetes bacterium]|nr:serine/threonine protein kinase [Planctomycetota bacterium]